ncbi:hypothetical protein AAFF_G00293410 [Aldrovandia affinis]|uniref:G-protein coupled receptors family 1 profile domain-containing protein n=1 Tax=Aldrovandia affinis TaxID=143900 RepID=A0AAD7R9X3_9TELE|nr:hypothetical protein AAFF_G00293410 [Aldrovandia affinis]
MTTPGFNLTQDWDYSGYIDYSYPDYNASEPECGGAESGAGYGAVRAALYCVVLLVGVPGNVALLGALCNCGTGAGLRRRRWRTGEILAANLAVSDLLFLGALPLWIHSEANTGEWSGGEATCKLAPYVTALTMYVGVLLLTIMSIDRYVAVVHPSVYRRMKKHALAVGSCVLCWLASALLALPVLQVRGLQRAWPGGAVYCGEQDRRAAAYPPGASLALLLLTFFLPLLLILWCYCSLARALRSHARGAVPGSPVSLRRAARMVLLVAGAFLLCWLPFNAFKLLGALERCLAPPLSLPPPAARCALQLAARTGLRWTAPLGFAHSAVNPLAYAAADRSLRRAILRGAPCPCGGRREGGARGGANSKASSQTTPTSWGEGGRGEREGGRETRDMEKEVALCVPLTQVE